MITYQSALYFEGSINSQAVNTAEKLEAFKFSLYTAIDAAISDGIDTFVVSITKTNFDIDIITAQLVLSRKRVIKPNDPKEIKLVILIPFENQSDKWSEKNREPYFKVLEQCDEVITLNALYKDDCPVECSIWASKHCGKSISYDKLQTILP